MPADPTNLQFVSNYRQTPNIVVQSLHKWLRVNVSSSKLFFFEHFENSTVYQQRGHYSNCRARRIVKCRAQLVQVLTQVLITVYNSIFDLSSLFSALTVNTSHVTRSHADRICSDSVVNLFVLFYDVYRLSSIFNLHSAHCTLFNGTTTYHWSCGRVSTVRVTAVIYCMLCMYCLLLAHAARTQFAVTSLYCTLRTRLHC